MIRRLIPLSAVVAAGLLLSSCASASNSSSSASAAPQAPTSITVALAAQPPGTDPILTRSIAAWNIYYNIYDGLTRLDAAGKVEPGLATTWSSSSDGLTWTFAMRKNVKFSDGTTMTPEDVVFTYETILASPNSTNKAAIAVISGVTATASGDVVFTLKNPYSAFEKTTATIAIVPQAAYTAAAGAFAANPVGSGPYEFVSQTAGVDYVVTRNDDYWGAKPAVKDVTFAFVADEDARVNGVSSASLQAAVIPPNQVVALTGSSGVSVQTKSGNQVVFIGSNSSSGPLADVRIRSAISQAIDRDALAEKLLGGLAAPTGQIIAKGVTGYVPGIAVPTQKVAAAKKLIAASGYDGTPITLEYASSGGLAQGSDVAQAIEGYLTAIGLKITLVGSDQASFNLKLAKHAVTGLYLNGWAPSVMDGDVVVNQVLAGGPEDYAGNAEMKTLFTRQQSTTGSAREAVYKEIDALNTKLNLAIPLYTNNYSFATSPKITFPVPVDGIIRLYDFTGK